MSVKKASIALALAVVCALGCHSSNSPTSSSGFQIVITIGVANTALAATIIEAQLVFDGAVATDVTNTTAVALVSLGASGSVASGPHTMQVLIVNQTSSPNNYTVTTPSVQIFDAAGNFIKTIQLPTESASVATGGSINYTFTL